MITEVVARRYAQALHHEATGEVAVHADMTLLQRTLDASPELVRCLQSPVISREKKRAVVERLFGQRVHAATLRFLHLLISRRREALLTSIVQYALALQDEAHGVVRVQARVSSPLADASRRRLEQTLGQRLGKQVHLQVGRDDTLLGGMVLRVGDTVYDGSVRHQLSRLRSRLSAHAL